MSWTGTLKKFEPRPYQRTAIKLCLQHGGFGVLLRPGLGKTCVMLAVFKILKKEGIARKVLVVAPRRAIHEVWNSDQRESDFRIFSDFRDLTALPAHGSKKERVLAAGTDFVSVTPEGLAMFVDEVVDPKGRTKYYIKPEYAKDWPFDMLIVDESTKFKHSGTKRFRRLKVLLDCFSRRYILTGSLAPKGYMNLFAQFMIIDGGRALGRYITHYRKEYFNPVGFGGFKFELKEGAAERIKQALKSVAYHVDDESNIPEMVVNDIWVELPPAARKIYDEVEKEFFAELQNGTVTAVNAGAKSVKLRQIASGAVYADPTPEDYAKNTRRVQNIHDVKLEALNDLIEEYSGEPILCGYEFDHERVRIQEYLKKHQGLDVPAVSGATSDKKASEIFKAFNDSEHPILLGQPQSMAHALNLQRGGQGVAWYSLTYKYEEYDQFIRRVRRQGSKMRKIVVHRILSRNTVDEILVGTILRDETTQKDILEAFKDYGSTRGLYNKAATRKPTKNPMKKPKKKS